MLGGYDSHETRISWFAQHAPSTSAAGSASAATTDVGAPLQLASLAELMSAARQFGGSGIVKRSLRSGQIRIAGAVGAPEPSAGANGSVWRSSAVWSTPWGAAIRRRLDPSKLAGGASVASAPVPMATMREDLAAGLGSTPQLELLVQAMAAFRRQDGMSDTALSTSAEDVLSMAHRVTVSPVREHADMR